MRHTLTIALLQILALTAAGQTARLTGQILNAPEGGSIVIMTGEERSDTVSLAADGTFEYAKDIKKPALACLLIPKTRIYGSVFLENNRHSHFEADARKPTEQRVSGDLAAVHAYMTRREACIRAVAEQGAADFTAYERRFHAVADSLLAEATALGDDGFTTYETGYLADATRRMLTNFFRWHPAEAKDDAAYARYMESVDLDDMRGYTSNSTFTCLAWLAAKAYGGGDNDYFGMLRILPERIKNPAVREKMAWQLARIYLISDAATHADEAYEIAAKILAGTQNGEELRKLHDRLSGELAPGAVAPDFNIQTPEGQTVRFSSLRGRVLFIDLWSTWCGPCCKEIPHVARLAERYKDDPRIKFVSISIDQNLSDWRSFIREHNATWPQYVVPNAERKAFLKLYSINGIPRFLLISADGRIINMHCPRPSSPDIIGVIEAAIGAK